MATVQIAFTDNSDNEDKFTVYRSDDGQAVTSVASEAVGEIAWSAAASVWQITSGPVDGSNSLAFVGAAPTADFTNNNSFTITYEESSTGTFTYGVEAENSIGKSATTSATPITIT